MFSMLFAASGSWNLRFAWYLCSISGLQVSIYLLCMLFAAHWELEPSFRIQYYLQHFAVSSLLFERYLYDVKAACLDFV